MKEPCCIFWFRRDLRLDDNRGLWEALRSGHQVLPVFIFDTDILKELPRNDARVAFLHDRIHGLRAALRDACGGSLAILEGTPKEAFARLLSEWDVRAVYTNHDYEPYARKRDAEIAALLHNADIPFHAFKDQVIFEKNEVAKEDGAPYVVYTPYMKKWKEEFHQAGALPKYDTRPYLAAVISEPVPDGPGLSDLGFTRPDVVVPDPDLSPALIQNYGAARDYPGKDATSHLGPHLRFGTVSVRKAVRQALKSGNETFWNELIWREFFMQILWHYPNTVHEAFKKPYDRIRWRNREEEFEKWKAGQTGYALVDAGMRQLNQTGYMHNRVRMLVASFLCKHLLIDWRWGEAYFAEKLLDYELASNVGNWQWAAGSGVDAAPYFRIFNPMTQVDKFDKDLSYIKKWVPEYGTDRYPAPMVDHKLARERCLDAYRSALEGATS